MTIRWITPLLGTAPALSVDDDKEISIIDVRDLVDKPGNSTDAILRKITEGCASLNKGKKTVVCCDYGISRSNAIAVGILSVSESIPFEAATRFVLDATGEKDIKVAPLQAVRSALDKDKKAAPHGKLHVLITGGNGFLGKAVNRALSELFDVSSPSRADLDLLHGSTQLDLLVGEKQVACIVHLANPRIYTSNIALGETLAMLRNVIDVCIARDARLIYLSSWEVYSGYRSAHLLADESLPLLPRGPHAEAKYLCEMLIEHCRRTQGLNCAILRSSLVFGIGGDKPKFIYNFMDKAIRSQVITTHRYRNGFPALDLLYIDDLVDAVSKLVSSNFSGNLNIGTGITTTTRDIAQLMLSLLGGDSEINSSLIESDMACIAMDSGKAAEVLGWRAKTGIEQGIKLILSDSVLTKEI